MPDIRIQLYNTRIDLSATGVTVRWLDPLIEILDLYGQILAVMERGPTPERGSGPAAHSDETISSPLHGGGGGADDVERVLPRLVPGQGTGQEGAE